VRGCDCVIESLTYAAVRIGCKDRGGYSLPRPLVGSPSKSSSTSSKAVGYGTPRDTYEVTRLFKSPTCQAEDSCYGGHEGGIVAFGRDLEGRAVLMRERRREADSV
jgi:hypothetical protein